MYSFLKNINICLVPILLSVMIYQNLSFYMIDSNIAEMSVNKIISLVLIIILLPEFLSGMKNKKLGIVYILFIYIIVHNFFSQQSLYDFMMKNIESLLFPIIFIYGYNVASEGKLRKLVSIYVFTFICAIILFEIKFKSLADFMSGDYVFSVIVILPLFFFLKNKYLRIILLILLSIVTIISLKRSVFLGLLLFFISYVYYNGYIKLSLKNISILIIVSALCYIAFIYLYSEIFQLLNRFENITDDQGSGRIYIYTMIYDNFRNNSILSQLFGSGQASVYERFGIYAHNDYLEFLYDYGYIGLLIFIVLICKLLFNKKVSLPDNEEYKSLESLKKSTVLLYIVLSLLNCVIYSFNIISPLFLTIGLCIGRMESIMKKINC